MARHVRVSHREKAAIQLFLRAVGNNRLHHLDALIEGAREMVAGDWDARPGKTNIGVLPSRLTSDSWLETIRQARLLGEFCEGAMELLGDK